jgi:hypothetical protein
MTPRRSALVAVATAAALTLAACGGGGGSGSTSSPGGGGSTNVDAAKQRLCQDLLLIQSGFRPDALTRFLTRLKIDREAFVSAGDSADAAKVKVLEAAAMKLRHALLAQQGVQQGQQKLQNAIDKLGC